MLRLPEGIISVYALIEGPTAKRTIKMALDTGATFTMIPPEKIMAAGYKIPITKDKMIKIFTASGAEYLPIVRISSFSCLGITVKNMEVLCHNLPSEGSVEGLLGLNFLVHLPAFEEFFHKIKPTL